VSYSAAIETAARRDTDPQAAELTQRVEREAKRRGFSQAPRQVVIGDGALWIWNLAEELFPQALQIVDRCHVKEHLSQVAKALYGQDEAADRWAQGRHQELDSWRWRSLTRALARHAGRSPEAGN
jgi:transposase